MRTQSAYQRVVETTRTEYNGGPRMPDADSYEYGRFGEVMRMIRAGKCDEEIVDRYPEFANYIDVLAVYRKIANGTIRKGREIMHESTRTDANDKLTMEIIRRQLRGIGDETIAEQLGVGVKRVRSHTRCTMARVRGMQG